MTARMVRILTGANAHCFLPGCRVSLSEGYPFAVRFNARWYIFIAKTLEYCLQWTTAIKSHIKPQSYCDWHPSHLFEYTLGVHKELRDERWDSGFCGVLDGFGCFLPDCERRRETMG